MTDPKQPPSPDTSGYPEQQPTPSKGKPRLPGQGSPHESQNNPTKKPGKH